MVECEREQEALQRECLPISQALFVFLSEDSMYECLHM